MSATALLDARVGRKPTGIGAYIGNLVAHLAEDARYEIVPLVELAQVVRMCRLGLRPVPVLPRGAPRRVSRADLVHGPNFHAPDLGIPAVATFHDLGYLRLPECHPPGMPEALDALVRASLRWTRQVICVSASARDDFVETYGVPAERCPVVHLGVDASWFEPPDPAALAAARRRHRLDRPYLLHVGALIPRKDVGTLLEAFREIADEHPELDLVLAGNRTRRWATDWDRIEDWRALHQRLAGRVRSLDYVPLSDLRHLYAAARAVVSSTLWEGFGLTVLEAFAVGRAVVSSDVGAIPEVAGGFAELGTPRDPASYADAIRRALAEPDGGPRASAARAHARSFTWQRTAEATTRVYDAVVGT